jgi:hypothetical protein
MTWALANWKFLLIAVLVALLGFFQLRIDREQKETANVRSEFADYRASQAEAGRLAERSRRETEQHWAQATEGVANDGQKKVDMARADAERAGAAERRLQERVAAFLSAINRAASDSGIAPTGTAAADPSVLLADLFGRARERARLLGKFADDSHARGQTCERYADGLQPPP